MSGWACLACALLMPLASAMLNEIHDSRCEPEKLPVIDAGIMDSKRLQMFYVSVKEGSFAAAAQILTVSPSAVSHAMKALEEDLDCALFRRSGPQVTPTGAAMRLLPMVEDMLVRMSAIKHELAATHGRQESLVFRLPVGLADLVRTGVLSTFHECFPAADLEMILREESGAVGKLDFEIDHAHRVPREMVRRDLMVEEFHAHVAPFHELGQKSRVTPAELRRFLCILPDAFVSESLARQMEPGAAGRIKKWMVPDAVAASGLARNGQGIAFLTNLAAADAVADGSLVRLKLPGVVIRRTCCAWWSPQRPLTWVAEVFLSLLETRMLSVGDRG